MTMHITKLVAENFKRLRAVAVQVSGNVVKVTGANAQGKSSVLDAIWFALQNPGTAVIPKPIRSGAAKAVVKIDVGDLTVKRTQTASGTTLEITASGSAAPLKSPQAVLDRLLGMNLDPMEFMTLKEKEQVDVLLDAAGLRAELNRIDTERKTAYDERTYRNRQLKTVTAQLPEIPPQKAEAVEATALLAKLRAAEADNRKRDDAELAVVAAQAEADELYEAYNKALEKHARMQEKLDGMAPVTDTSALEAKVNNASAINASASAWTNYVANKKQAEELQASVDAMTAAIEALDAAKRQAITDMEVAVDGLDLDDNGLTLNGIPLKQASDSEQIRTCVAIAAATIPADGIRVLRIKGGSLLDTNSMAVLEKALSDMDVQAWIECVDETGQVGIVIEDGEVAANNYAEDAANE